MFGWCQYRPTDEIESYDHAEIKVGSYYIECENAWPFRGNGWYADMFVYVALEFKLITKHNIIYQLIPIYLLASWFFTKFVDEVAHEFKQISKPL